MTEGLSNMILKPIGTVRNGIEERPNDGDWWSELVSEIEIEPSLKEALDGLEEFSHIMVFFWMHRLTQVDQPLKVRPMGKKDNPLTGVLATRTPWRPNRIGITTVKLLECRGNILKVKGLDALDGSPVIDIKPYIPIAEPMTDVGVPRWIKNQ